MLRLAALALVIAGLALGACGDDEETAATTTGADAQTTDAGQAGARAEITAKQFIAASIPEQVHEVRRLVAEVPACGEVDASPGGDFQIAIAINAAQAKPETPLAEIVADQCAGG